jgi:hypothetical protein
MIRHTGRSLPVAWRAHGGSARGEPFSSGRRRIPKRLEQRGDPRSRGVARPRRRGLRMRARALTCSCVETRTIECRASTASRARKRAGFSRFSVRRGVAWFQGGRSTAPDRTAARAVRRTRGGAKARRGCAPALQRPWTPLRTVAALHRAHSISVRACSCRTMPPATSCP